MQVSNPATPDKGEEMRYMFYKISRYWNKVCIYGLTICTHLLWDFNKHNQFIKDDLKRAIDYAKIIT